MELHILIAFSSQLLSIQTSLSNEYQTLDRLSESHSGLKLSIRIILRGQMVDK